MSNQKPIKVNFLLFIMAIVTIFLLVGCGQKKAETIRFPEPEVTIVVGDKTSIEAIVFPNDIKNLVIEWSSDKDAVATVSQSGEVSAVGVGSANITAAVDDISAVLHVTVIPVPEIYNVTFIVEGGTEVAEQEVVEGSKIIKPTNPTKEGYVFKGWYASRIISLEFDFDSIIKKDTTIYAKWDVIKYQISFESNQGSAVLPRTVNYGSKLSAPSAPKKTGYVFLGWYTDEQLLTAYDYNTEVKSEFTLYAKWELAKVTVSFASNGGSAMQSIELIYGNKLTQPVNPTKLNYLFDGWYSDYNLTELYNFDTLVTEDMSLYAKWNLDLSTFEKVTFQTNGGSFPFGSSNAFVAPGNEPIQTYSSNISFDGDRADPDLFSSYVFILTTTVRTEWWTAVGLKQNSFGLYEVTTKVSFGAIDAGEFVDCDYIITAWVDALEAHTFVESIEIGQIVTGFNIDENGTPGAVEGAIINTYVSGSNYTEINANLFKENDELPVPIKSGYVFEGWYDTSDFSGDIITKVSKETKLYAKWVSGE